MARLRAHLAMRASAQAHASATPSAAADRHRADTFTPPSAAFERRQLSAMEERILALEVPRVLRVLYGLHVGAMGFGRAR